MIRRCWWDRVVDDDDDDERERERGRERERESVCVCVCDVGKLEKTQLIQKVIKNVNAQQIDR